MEEPVKHTPSNEDSPTQETNPVRKKKKKSYIPWIFTLMIALGIVAVIVYGSKREKAEPVAAEKKMPNIEVQTVTTQEFVGGERN